MVRFRNYGGGMISSNDHDWVSVARAAEIAGCSEQFIRRELEAHFDAKSGLVAGGRVEGFRAGERAWIVSRKSAEALRSTLSTRARLHEAARKQKKRAAKRARKTT